MNDRMRSIFINRREFLAVGAGSLFLAMMSILGMPSSVRAAGKTTGKDAKKMTKYVCTVCGYVYDPEEGDPVFNIPPGTPFEELPDYWVCPTCGAEKSSFEVWA